MKRFLRALVALTLLMGTLLGIGSAAAAGPETLTINADITTPAGRPLIGAFVVQRSANNGAASWTFNGMLDGKHATASGTAIERWTTSGTGTIELTAITAPGVTLDSLPIRTITLNVGSSGIITVLGVPLAISGPIRAPGAGDALVFLTNAGQGSRRILSLPNTAGAAALPPELVAGLLCAFGMGLLYLGMRRRRVGRAAS